MQIQPKPRKLDLPLLFVVQLYRETSLDAKRKRSTLSPATV